MESKRKSLRNVSHCASIPNIFKQATSNQPFLRYIPHSIFKKIDKTSSISCSFISELPPFEEEGETEEELRLCLTAS
jgi:hypothetical protein